MDQIEHLPSSRSATGHAALEPAPDDWVFALDIGTRTIIGVVGVQRGSNVEVLGAHVVEHEERAMMDGQIHDIAKVAQAALAVRDALSRQVGRRLEKVAIAAAGRVLRTCQVQVEREIDPLLEIDAQLVGALEMEGIRRAQDLLSEQSQDTERSPFHCVGYSVVHYLLDDMPITNLLGHKGRSIGLDVLATFLPQVVVDSLHTVMERVGLQVTNMTLEPIAALNVAIPRDLRMLNLALVDVGAGTSDIAVTKGGTVVAYAMVPSAGDEISECIAQHYLVDFKTAESVKLAVSAGQEDIRFLDILDNEVHVERSAVLSVIAPAVELLATTLSERMTESNAGRSPNAVFLVGGGSQTPGLAQRLAELLGLPQERVAVRNRSIAKNITYEGSLLQGPECITPFGILVTAFAQAGRDFFHVFVEDRRIRLYNARRMTISDALLLAGYVPDQLIGKSGKSMTITVNGEEKVLRGGFGKPAVIELNGFAAGLTATVSPGDHIHVVEAERGPDATALAGDQLLSVQPVVLVLAGTRYPIPLRLLCNGREITPEATLRNEDTVTVQSVESVAELAGMFELPLPLFRFFVGGVPVDETFVPQLGDEVVCLPVEPKGKVSERTPNTLEKDSSAHTPDTLEKDSSVHAPDTLEKDSQAQAFPGALPEAPIPALDVPNGVHQTSVADAAPRLEDGFYVTVDGAEVFLPKSSGEHMLIDIFAHIDFDLNHPKGTVLLRLNGREAGYTDVIKPADKIEIIWQE